MMLNRKGGGKGGRSIQLIEHQCRLLGWWPPMARSNLHCFKVQECSQYLVKNGDNLEKKRIWQLFIFLTWMMKHQCNVVRVDNVALCSLWAFSWRFKQEWLGVEKGQSQGSRARNMGFQGKDGTIARSWWWKIGASVVGRLNFLSVPIFVAFKSPSPARRRVMLDLIVGARKKTR